MIFLLNKPENISSFKFINNFKKIHNFEKIGHCGTLDPLASGLLLVATNEDTKLIPYLDQKSKTYVARAKLGIKTSTYDAEGKIIDKSENIKFSKKKILEILNSFLGISTQIPPKFSAKKINGKRAYDLARKNIDFEIKEIQINIFSINLLNYCKDENYFDFEVSVSRGTYIRSLINDIGIKLKSYAYMEKLKRIKIGNFFLKDGETKKELEALNLIKTKILNISKNQLKILYKGFKIEINLNDNFFTLCYNDKIIGFAKLENNNLKSTKLFGKKIQKILRGENE